MRYLIKTLFPCIVFLFAFSSHINADNSATEEEIVEKCAQVAEIVKNEGIDKAVEKVNDTSGPFVWKDTYVYIMDMQATITAHGPVPKFRGKNLMGLKDPVTRKPWYPGVYERIKSGEKSGWFDYHWKKAEGSGIYKKHCYFHKAGDHVVFAGIYKERVK